MQRDEVPHSPPTDPGRRAEQRRERGRRREQEVLQHRQRSVDIPRELGRSDAGRYWRRSEILHGQRDDADDAVRGVVVLVHGDRDESEYLPEGPGDAEEVVDVDGEFYFEVEA